MLWLVLLVAGAAATGDNCIRKQDDAKTNSMIQMRNSEIKHGFVLDDEVDPDEVQSKTYSMLQVKSAAVKQPLILDDDEDGELSEAEVLRIKRVPIIAKAQTLAKEVLEGIQMGVDMKVQAEEDLKSASSSAVEKLNKAKNDAKRVIEAVKKTRQNTMELKTSLKELGENVDKIEQSEKELEEVRKIEQAKVMNKGFAKLAYMKDDAKMEMLATFATSDLKAKTSLENIQARMVEEKQKFENL